MKPIKPKMKTSKETNIHCLSKNVQNEFVYFLSKKIQDHILEQLRHAKKYPIKLDCASVVSNTKQMTFVARFFKIAADEDVFNMEAFSGFVPIVNSSCEGLKEVLPKEVQARGIPFK